MSKLDEVFTKYREICFLVNETMENHRDDSIKLMALTQISSKDKVIELMLKTIERTDDMTDIDSTIEIIRKRINDTY